MLIKKLLKQRPDKTAAFGFLSNFWGQFTGSEDVNLHFLVKEND